ncbi:MAG TPA: acyltransferase family protein [Segeticoccus sp.]|uniref:acyltransferase family protein n=1 Tax=Segeticoccus sp. TaxID=2706531 RepID=UPI002D80ABEF|nr:acyltransferase family protein [Segeticoccus sp.]HET8601463.1 acyltransferase family protein [Segeticoccus sp.]
MTHEAVDHRRGTIHGLDGLRALAILGVLVYHLRSDSLPGGYLGVDVFFVVSGFLITTLLLRELRDRGRLDLPHFWLRRARRLLPALVLVVVCSIVLGFAVGDDLLVHIARQTVGALTFSNNWVEIAAGSSYFAHTSPLLFMNFWSLAVEEQFYLFWPLALALILALARSTAVRVRIALLLAAASALAMAVIFQVGGDATRVYYGTDTHLFGLMIGAALAFTWAAPERPLESRRWQRVRMPVAAVSLVGLLALMRVLDQPSGFTFRGGILLASLLTAGLIAALLGPDSLLRRALDLPPLVWVGQRSYGIYLWHWPMILVVTAALPATTADSAMSWTGRGLAVALTLVLSWASYRWLEVPVRRLGFRGALGAFGRWVAQPWEVSRVPRLTGGVIVTAVLVTAIAITTAPDKSQVQQQLEANAALANESVSATVHGSGSGSGGKGGPGAGAGDRASSGAARGDAKGAAAHAATGRGSAGKPQDGGPADGAGTGPAPHRSNSSDSKSGAAKGTGAVSRTADFSMPTGKEITVFGDSLVVCSADALLVKFPGIMMDAKSNRQWPDGQQAVQSRLAQGTVRRAVVLDFGTNAGVQDKGLVGDVIKALGPDRMIVLVNLYGVWVPEGNEALADIASHHPNVIVANWHDAIAQHPELLQPDGIHPGIEGAHLYADVVSRALHQLSHRLQAAQKG